MPHWNPTVIPEKILKRFEIFFVKTARLKMRTNIQWKKEPEDPAISAEQIIRKTCSSCCWIDLDVRVPRPNLLDKQHIWFSPLS